MSAPRDRRCKVCQVIIGTWQGAQVRLRACGGEGARCGAGVHVPFGTCAARTIDLLCGSDLLTGSSSTCSEREQQALADDPTTAELAALADARDRIARDRDAVAAAHEERAAALDHKALRRDLAGSGRDGRARAHEQDLDAGPRTGSSPAKAATSQPATGRTATRTAVADGRLAKRLR